MSDEFMIWLAVFGSGFFAGIGAVGLAVWLVVRLFDWAAEIGK